MILNLSEALKNLFSAVFLVLVARIFAEAFPSGLFSGPRPGSGVLKKATVAGIAGACVVAALEASFLLRDREVYGGVLQGLAFVAELILLLFVVLEFLRLRYRPEGRGRAPKSALSFLVAVILIFRISEFLWFASRTFGSGQLSLNSEFLAAFFLLVLGLGLGFVVFLGIARSARELPPGLLLILGGGILLSEMAVQALAITQSVLARGVRIPWLVKIVIPLINGKDIFLYLQAAAVAFIPVLRLFQKPKSGGDFSNPAQKRKAAALKKRAFRWVLTSLSGLGVGFFIVAFGPALFNKPVELSPAQTVVAENGKVVLPLSAVDDGHLHRFAYYSGDGVEIRFIVIKKGGSAYGIGLDACDVCGPTGYYERDNEVVCKLCDVVMNKATIGFKGGCNPVPIAYRMENKAIILSVATLEAEKKRFQ